jgi:membrane protein YdbS with pleckstrin-like domain
MSAPQAPKVLPKHLKATYLGDQEVLLEETRGTKWYYFPGPVVLAIIFGALTYLSWGGRMGWAFTHTYVNEVSALAKLVHLSQGPHGILLLGIAAIVAVVFLISLLWLLVRYLRWISTVYAVTSNRVIVQKGILGKNFDEIPVTQVRGVDVHQTFGQRILHYGTLRVSSEGGARIGNEDWNGIPRPFDFQKRLENASEAIDRSGRPPR